MPTGIYPRTKEHNEKIRLSSIGKNSGRKNGMWKGDKVGYESLHQYLRIHLPKSELCQSCKKIPPHDLANITGIYNRDPVNWKWLCRRCHMLSDGRMNNLKQFS
jgi:hypothetical protein